MILITGASGTVGSEVVKALAASGARMRAGYRTRPQNVPAGVESVALDYERPETIRPALAGVEAVFLLSSSVQPERNVVDEARCAGVKRIVKLSVLGAAQEAFSFARWHRPVERHIEASGLQIRRRARGSRTLLRGRQGGRGLARGAPAHRPRPDLVRAVRAGLRGEAALTGFPLQLGASSGSSGSGAGRRPSGTCSRFTRRRVHVVWRPRMASIRTSAGWRWDAASGCRAFQRSSPASASSFLEARPISTSGFTGTRRPPGLAPVLLFDGCTRGGSPGCLA
jgi:hypothetical protein